MGWCIFCVNEAAPYYTRGAWASVRLDLECDPHRELGRYLRYARVTAIVGLSVSVPNAPWPPAGCVGAC